MSAVLTGGITSGLNLGATVDANGNPVAGAASQGWQGQLSQNLQAAGVRAVVNTAVNGASLERNLASEFRTALVDTGAAQSAS